MNKSATAEAVVKEDLANLPVWDLTDLYESPDCRALTDDLALCETEAKDLESRCRGRLDEMSGDDLGQVLADYERLQERLSRILSYAQLTYSSDMSDPAIGRFYQSMQERATAISARLVFFTLELNLISDEAMAEKYRAPALARFRPWIEDQRIQRPHQLAEDLERLLHEKYVSGRAAWTRLFDETMAGLRFPFDGRDLTSAEILNLLSDSDAGKREAAATSLGKVLGENSRLFALITNTLAKDKETEDTWRGFARPVSSRNLANLVEDEVVDALVSAVRDAYPRLAHRYYALKARWFGVEKLPYWDRNAPLPEDVSKTLSWQTAQRSVLEAYGAFSPDMAAVGQRFFDHDWIDVPVRPGKAPGAFAHPTVPSVHPYLLLNYQGRLRDVMTLAHELGHGVHQVLAGGQGYLLSNTPLTLAETASVFGEMLTFQSLLKAESDPRQRKVMLASKVEDMLNTVVRQISMHCFETKVHDERRSGELLPERLGEIWLETQQESLGPAIKFDDNYRHYWSYIPHFVHVPFYVYAYAFGDCLVNSLYAVYESSREGFAEKYLDMLRAGGSKRHRELLAPFGLDATDPDFWKKGLDLTGRFIDELEAL